MSFTKLPGTILTADTWLWQHQRDLHLMLKAMRPHVDDEWESEYVSPVTDYLLPIKLSDWLTGNQPNVAIGVIRKRVVYSKHYWQCWYVSMVNFSAEELALYCSVWEGADQRAEQAGFRRLTIPYANWGEVLAGKRKGKEFDVLENCIENGWG